MIVRARAAALSHLGWSSPQGARMLLRAPFSATYYAWGPKAQADAWLAQAVPAPLLASELWLYPRDARAALNGSGLLIVNPPWLILERMQVWLPELQGRLAVGAGGGSSARMVTESRA